MDVGAHNSASSGELTSMGELEAIVADYLDQAAGAEPSNGSTNFPTIGTSRNRSAALTSNASE
jgi:hypothetical protein